MLADLKELTRLEITLKRPNNDPFVMDLMMDNNAQLEGHRTEKNDLKVKIELQNQNILRIIGSTSMKLTGVGATRLVRATFPLITIWWTQMLSPNLAGSLPREFIQNSSDSFQSYLAV